MSTMASPLHNTMGRPRGCCSLEYSAGAGGPVSTISRAHCPTVAILRGDPGQFILREAARANNEGSSVCVSVCVCVFVCVWHPCRSILVFMVFASLLGAMLLHVATSFSGYLELHACMHTCIRVHQASWVISMHS
jgi:hypothetical protein